MFGEIQIPKDSRKIEGGLTFWEDRLGVGRIITGVSLYQTPDVKLTMFNAN